MFHRLSWTAYYAKGTLVEFDCRRSVCRKKKKKRGPRERRNERNSVGRGGIVASQRRDTVECQAEQRLIRSRATPLTFHLAHIRDRRLKVLRRWWLRDSWETYASKLLNGVSCAKHIFRNVFCPSCASAVQLFQNLYILPPNACTNFSFRVSITLYIYIIVTPGEFTVYIDQVLSLLLSEKKPRNIT